MMNYVEFISVVLPAFASGWSIMLAIMQRKIRKQDIRMRELEWKLFVCEGEKKAHTFESKGEFRKRE
jgi:hypothetical protein